MIKVGSSRATTNRRSRLNMSRRLVGREGMGEGDGFLEVLLNETVCMGVL